MSKKEEFKAYVRHHPNLVTKVKNNETNWQKLYEIYDLYGEDESAWEPYLSSTKKETTSSNSGFDWRALVDTVKKVDPDTVQKGIGSLIKGLDLVQGLIKPDKPKDTYTPRPLFKRFED